MAHPTAALGAAIVCLYALMALTAPLVAPYDPIAMDGAAILSPPSARHWLGTDEFGRDLLSRVIYGSRPALAISTGAVALSLVLGSAIGIASGFWGGRLDSLLMRLMDVLLAFPATLLALSVMVVMGESSLNVVVAIGIVYIPQFARVSRAAVLEVRGADYIEAARALGVRELPLIFRHVLPNMTAPLIVQASLTFSLSVLYESALAFLGMGTKPPMPSWGLMLSSSRAFMEVAPWTAVVPGAAIMLLILGFNLLGDGLRDMLDPRLKGLDRRW